MGLAWCTTHFNSIISFSLTESLDPDLTPSISIFVGGTENKIDGFNEKQKYYVRKENIGAIHKRHRNTLGGEERGVSNSVVAKGQIKPKEVWLHRRFSQKTYD